MQGISMQDLARHCGATLTAADSPVSGIAIDSRKVADGDLFVAIKGERVDGHEFLASARQAGAVGAVVQEAQDDALAQIVVGDTTRALASMAALNRNYFKGPVIAITGSAGKTTCKNMLAAILAEAGKVCVTEGNLNNELGVPLTVSRISDSDDFAVIEMGAAQRGDIAYLCNIARPDIAVLTNVAEAHIGRFGDLQTTALTKGEIYDALPDGGLAVLNADDPYAELWRKNIAAQQSVIRIVEFSLQGKSASLSASDIRTNASGLAFVVHVKLAEQNFALSIELPLLGRHNIANALAAIAVALELGVPGEAIKKGLQGLRPATGRLQLRVADNDILLIDDSYNANPRAIEAAAEVLQDLASTEGRKQVVALGDMAELGEHAKQLHFDVGVMLAGKGVDELLLIGEYASYYASGFQSACPANSNVQVLDSQQELVKVLHSENLRGAAVLVKGSRAAAMDRVCDALTLNTVSNGEERAEC